MPPGTRVVYGKLSILEEYVQEDALVPADLRTAVVLKTIANQTSPMILMKEDVSSNHSYGTLPILDLEVWVSGQKVFHRFYKKPISSRKVVHARSALSISVK